MNKSLWLEITAGVLACFIGVYLVAYLLKDVQGWTGGEEQVFIPAQTWNRTNANNANLVLTAQPVKRKAGKEFTKFGITEDMFIEGHWWGMEVENLTPLAKQILKIPPNINGLWVDETNLWAVRSGIKGADIIQSINGRPVRNLGEFYRLTKKFRETKKVRLGILRGEKKLSVILAPGPPLGIAAMESADSLDPMTSDAAVDPLDLTEEAPASFPTIGYKALVQQ